MKGHYVKYTPKGPKKIITFCPDIFHSRKNSVQLWQVEKKTIGSQRLPKIIPPNFVHEIWLPDQPIGGRTFKTGVNTLHMSKQFTPPLAMHAAEPQESYKNSVLYPD